MRELDEYAKLDVDRLERTGVPEIVLAEGKRDDHLREIVGEMARETGRVLVSRLAPERFPVITGLDGLDTELHERARLAIVHRPDASPPETGGRVGVLAAGTSDLPILDEVRVTARELGCHVRTAADVGVAGLHRLYPELGWAREVDCLVVVAGREGALPTVVAGLVDAPVIAVPVGTGYGVGGEGEAALKSMLQSCAPLTVVNVDAGVVAGACAARIANRVAAAREGDPQRGASVPEGDAREADTVGTTSTEGIL